MIDRLSNVKILVIQAMKENQINTMDYGILGVGGEAAGYFSYSE